MLTRNNFEDFVKSLDDNKKELCRDSVDQKEFIYIAFSSYGDILNFVPTNDNHGVYADELESDEWDGNSYLIQISEIIEITGE